MKSLERILVRILQSATCDLSELSTICGMDAFENNDVVLIFFLKVRVHESYLQYVVITSHFCRRCP